MRQGEVTQLHWATGSPGPTGPPEWLGFICKLAINIRPSFILIHPFLAQMEWILNLVGQGHPHAGCLALAAKLFFILQGEWRKKKKEKGVWRCSNCQLQWKARLKTLSLNPWTRKRRGVGSERQSGRSSGVVGGEKKGGRRWGSQQPPEWFICQIRTQWVDYESSNKRVCLGTH